MWYTPAENQQSSALSDRGAASAPELNVIDRSPEWHFKPRLRAPGDGKNDRALGQSQANYIYRERGGAFLFSLPMRGKWMAPKPTLASVANNLRQDRDSRLAAEVQTHLCTDCSENDVRKWKQCGSERRDKNLLIVKTTTINNRKLKRSTIGVISTVLINGMGERELFPPFLRAESP